MYITIKSITDRVIACVLILLLSPLFMVVSCLILIAMGRPIFFAQDRGGYNQQPFTIFKFRTMVTDQTGDDISRLTPLGHYLRKASLDELPQLINILKGDMSFIGPRPLLAHYLTKYNSYQKKRHNVKPGITGWAQVNGRNTITWDDRFMYDIHYVNHISLKMDIKIIMLTLYTVLMMKNVNSNAIETMPVFKGDKQ